MPRSFEGKTWVAFLDMSGFKQMMKDMSLAERALDKFYNTIFTEVIRTNHNFPSETYPSGKASISSLVVSDCAVIFVDNQKVKEDIIRDLHLILSVICQINRFLINPQKNPPMMTTCAIAYGDFKYVSRGADMHTENNYFYGQTYLRAYLGSEELRKMPGYCRILTKCFTIPDKLRTIQPFNLLDETNDYYNYYWMLDDLKDMKIFQEKYEGLSQEVYKHIADLLFKSASMEK